MSATQQFIPGCCCGCPIGSDKFNRADAADLGADWSLRAGSAAISGNAAVISAANSLSVFGPSGSALVPIVMQSALTFSAIGDKARLVLSYLDDANYLFVELTANTNHVATQLYKRTAGVNTALETAFNILSWSPGQTRTIRLCVGNGTFGATVTSGGSTFFRSTVTAPYGGQAGFGTGGTVTGAVTFDNFTLEYGKTATAKNCPQCGGGCTVCSDGGPRVWRAVVSGLDPALCGPDGPFGPNRNGTYMAIYGTECSIRTDPPSFSAPPPQLIVTVSAVSLVLARIDVALNVIRPVFTSSPAFTVQYRLDNIPRPLACLRINEWEIPYYDFVSTNGASGDCGIDPTKWNQSKVILTAF